VQESMTIDNTITYCIPRKINKSYKQKMDQLTKDRLKHQDCIEIEHNCIIAMTENAYVTFN